MERTGIRKKILVQREWNLHFPVCTAGAHRHRFELIEITVYHVYTLSYHWQRVYIISIREMFI